MNYYADIKYEELLYMEKFHGLEIKYIIKKCNPVLNESDILLLEEEEVREKESLLEKLIEKIKEIFEKFKTYMLTNFQLYSSFYEELLDNVDKLEEAAKNKIYEIFPYEGAASRIKKLNLPHFDYDRMEKHLDSEKSFIENYYTEIKSDGDFKDNLREYFRGGEKSSISGSDLKIEDMIRYNLNIKNLVNYINDELKKIDQRGRYKSILNEADDDNKSSSNVEIKDNKEDSGADGEDNNEEVKDKETSNTKANKMSHINTYMRTNHKVKSIKMEICREKFDNYHKIFVDLGKSLDTPITTKNAKGGDN